MINNIKLEGKKTRKYLKKKKASCKKDGILSFESQEMNMFRDMKVEE